MPQKSTTRHVLLDPKKVGDILAISPDTLRNWRTHKRPGLPYVKVGGAVRYREADVLAFLDAGLVDPTEQVAQ
jgi:hypothetical protein